MDDDRYGGPGGPSRGLKVLGLLVALALLVLGGLWTAQSWGLVGPDEASEALNVLGPLTAGLGVALGWVLLRPSGR